MNQTYLYLIKFYKSVLFIYLLLFTGQKLKTWWKCKILRDKCHKSDLISLTCNLKNLKMGKFCQLAHYTLFFCEYNSFSFFFAVRVLWSRRRLFCDYNIVKAMEPPTTTYTDFPWHYGRKHQTTSKNCPKNIHFFYQSSVQPNRHPIGLHVY